MQLTSPFQLHPQLRLALSKTTSTSPGTGREPPKEEIITRYTVPSKPRQSRILQNIPPITSMKSHPDTIDRLLSDLTTCLLTTSRNIPPNKFHPAKRPGWDPALKSASRSCKHHYCAWVRAGRPHSPENHLRIAHKSCLRLQRKRLNAIFYNSLDTNLNPRKFFLSVRNDTTSHRNQPITTRTSVDGSQYTNENITEGWAHYFEALGTPPPNLAHFSLPGIYRVISDIPNPEPDWVETSTIIHSLPRNKAAGPDHLTNEHLSFADDTLASILSNIFNVILATGHIPARPYYPHPKRSQHRPLKSV